MDNVTHSLFGYAIGRLAGDRGQRAEPEKRATVWSSVIASNVPDLDFVVGPLSHDPKLAYLLYHRGHTHTLVMALPLGMLVAVACARLMGVRETDARRRVLIMGGLAGLLHIAFDALNNYGVHPFYPLDNGWYYGDAVFIIEPLMLAALVPLPLWTARRWWGKSIAATVAVALLGLLWGVSLIPAGVGAATTLLLLAGVATQRLLRPGAGTTLVALSAVIAVYAGGSRLARARLQRSLADAVPAERQVELVTTPFPGNPLCWTGIAITSDGDAIYRARYGAVSLAPRVVAPAACAVMPRGETTAPLLPAELPGDGAVRWTHRFQGPLSELRQLSRQHCEAAAMLRFVRAPYWVLSQSPLLGDLRYDNGPGLDFAEKHVGDDCRDPVPPWTPPLEELLD
jgi:inner membrane protein